MNTYRCSSLSRYLRCSGSRAAEAMCPPRPDNEAAASGRRIHEALANYAKSLAAGSELRFDSVLSDDREISIALWFAKCLRQIVADNGGVAQVDVETRLTEVFAGATLTGCPDLIVWTKNGMAHLIDYKTGYAEQEPAWDNAQLAGYIALISVVHGVPEKGITAHLLSAGSEHPVTSTVYGEREAQGAINLVNEIITNCETTDAPRACGKQCRWCPASGNPVACPESTVHNTDLMIPASLTPDIAGRIAHLYDAAIVAENNISAFKDWVKEQLLSGQTIQGLALKEPASVREVTDVQSLFQAGIVRGWWDAPQFMESVKVSIADAEKIAKKNKGLKGKEWDAEWDNGTGALITAKLRAPSIRRVKEVVQ